MPNRSPATLAAVLIFTLLSTWPTVAHADDLSVLIYLLVVWPLGLLLSIGMVVMLIIASVKIRRRTGGRCAGWWIIGISMVLTVGHCVLTAICYQTVRTRPLLPAVIGVLPVLVLGIIDVLLGWKLVRRGKR